MGNTVVTRLCLGTNRRRRCRHAEVGSGSCVCRVFDDNGGENFGGICGGIVIIVMITITDKR